MLEWLEVLIRRIGLIYAVRLWFAEQEQEQEGHSASRDVGEWKVHGRKDRRGCLDLLPVGGRRH